MDLSLIRNSFESNGYQVSVMKFSGLDVSKDYKNVFFLYQTSESPGSFFKRYIEDLVYFLEKQGALVAPQHEFLLAHHNKIFMELMKSRFSDESLKTIPGACFGSWVDALNHKVRFPVVIKQSSGSAGMGVYLARNRKEYQKFIKKAGNRIFAENLRELSIANLKKLVKRIIKMLVPAKSNYYSFDTSPLSVPIIVQPFVEGLSGDYKVLIFGRKYYLMYRKNRDNDFRASGSGRFYEVPKNEHEGVLNFARRLSLEIDFPILGIDIGFDGNTYHLIEFQMIHLGPSALQRSKYWHEFIAGKWIKFNGSSIIEEEFSRAMIDFFEKKYLKNGHSHEGKTKNRSLIK